jgi:hypothetical protein
LSSRTRIISPAINPAAGGLRQRGLQSAGAVLGVRIFVIQVFIVPAFIFNRSGRADRADACRLAAASGEHSLAAAGDVCVTRA